MKDIISILQCPYTQESLELKSDNLLQTTVSKKEYIIKEGIIVLL